MTRTLDVQEVSYILSPSATGDPANVASTYGWHDTSGGGLYSRPSLTLAQTLLMQAANWTGDNPSQHAPLAASLTFQPSPSSSIVKSPSSLKWNLQQWAGGAMSSCRPSAAKGSVQLGVHAPG